TGYGPSCRQDEINALMIALAKAGRRVVRLKGGDPMIFGRGGEEIAACRAAQIPVEVVPGITAAQGAAARIGVSLTRRRDATRPAPRAPSPRDTCGGTPAPPPRPPLASTAGAGRWPTGGRAGSGGGWPPPPPPLRSPPRPGRGRRSSPAPCPISPPGSAPCRR